MAKIKSFTDIPQSKKLAEILPIESADMWWAWYSSPLSEGHYGDFPMFCKPVCNPDESVPCWSLAALLKLLEFPTLENDSIGKGKTGWMVTHYEDGIRYNTTYYSNAIDSCVEMILKLHELNLL